MTPKDQILIEELRRDEGVKYSPYDDTLGIQTVGVGHNMKARPIDPEWTFPLTDEQIDSLLAADLIGVFHDLDGHLGWWRNLSYTRMRVLANMTFNMGINGLLGFHNTLEFIKDGNYLDAAKGMTSSKWAHQVGQRAVRLADMMVTG